MNDIQIKVDGISKNYGDFEALKKITFQANKGNIIGLLGPNGAGKTTLLRLLSGITQPSNGTVEISGFSLSKQLKEAKAHIGFLTGDMNLYERLTPKELLYYFGALYGVTKSDLKEKVAHLIIEFTIHEYRHKRIKELSTGQKQRVAIARTLIHDPEVIILDEPTTGLDIMSCELVLSIVKKLATDQEKTVIFSTHNLSELERIADQILILSKGQIKAFDTLNSLLDSQNASNLSELFFSQVDQ